MSLKDVVSVSGLPGLYKLVTPRSNGLIIQDYDTDKRRFVSVRKHHITPLESVSIYTVTDSVEMKVIFRRMIEQLEDHPVPNPKAPETEIMEYFEDIVPDYDKTRVYPKDVRKVIKWFGFLYERKLLLAGDEEE